MKILTTVTFLLTVIYSFSQTYAIVADRVIDCKSDHAISNPTIIVRNGRIIDINYKRSMPDSAIIIDLKGHTVLPGLMDIHTHILAGTGDYEKDLYDHSPSYRALRAVTYLRTALNNGITTLRDVCTEGAGYADVDLARAVDSGFIDGPRIFPAGKGIAATGMYMPYASEQNWSYDLPHGTQYATGTTECIRAVREEYSHGVTWIKMFADFATPTFSFEEMIAIVNEANKLNLDVAAHANTKMGIRLAIEAGVRSIEHGREFNDTLIQLSKAHGTYWCPTIPMVQHNPRPYLDSVYKYIYRAWKAGVPIVMGTDISGSWNVSEAIELEYFVKKAALPAMDAIKTATVNTARLLHKQDILGQIEKGFIADIIAVVGDPLEDISLLQNVDFVMKAGKIIKQPGR